MPDTITPQIVTVDAVVTTAPAPSTLQTSGALVSEGGTTLTTGAYQYCGTLAEVTAILSSAGNYEELTNMATTFFAQSNTNTSPIGLWIVELGTQAEPSDGIAALTTWIEDNPNIFYAYLVPAGWDADGTNLNTLAATYSSPTGKTYFFVTTTTSTFSAYANTTKAIMWLVPSPTAADTEFQAAALFYQWLSNNPSTASLAQPMAYRYVYGVTPWALTNWATITTLLSANGNVIMTGSEGGISNALIRNGTTADGQQSMAWYAVDWLLINCDLDLSATIIEGPNSSTPLYYNQKGINSLLAVANEICSDAVAFGLMQSAITTATPFLQYTTQNPSNFEAGTYGGFACSVVTQNGFLRLTFNLNIIQFAS